LLTVSNAIILPFEIQYKVAVLIARLTNRLKGTTIIRGDMDIAVTLLNKHISADILKFNGLHICNFTKLDIVRFFGINPASRLDRETLLEFTGDKTADIDESLSELVKSHLLEVIKIDNKVFYELTKKKEDIENIKKFISLYATPSIRLYIIGYVMNRCVERP